MSRGSNGLSYVYMRLGSSESTQNRSFPSPHRPPLTSLSHDSDDPVEAHTSCTHSSLLQPVARQIEIREGVRTESARDSLALYLLFFLCTLRRKQVRKNCVEARFQFKLRHFKLIGLIQLIITTDRNSSFVRSEGLIDTSWKVNFKKRNIWWVILGKRIINFERTLR